MKRYLIILAILLLLSSIGIVFVLHYFYGPDVYMNLRNMPGYKINDLATYIQGCIVGWIACKICIRK